MEMVAWLIKNIGIIALLSVLTLAAIQVGMNVDPASLSASLTDFFANPVLANPAAKLSAVVDSL